MIDLLTKRGKALRTAKFSQAEKFEGQIEKFKQDYGKQMIIPTAAIIMFEDEKCKQLITNDKYKNKIELFGQKLNFEDA